MLHFQPCQLSDTGTRGLCPGWQLAVPRPGRLRRGLGLLLLPVQPGPSQTWYRSSIPFRRRLTHRGNVEREGWGSRWDRGCRADRNPVPQCLVPRSLPTCTSPTNAENEESTSLRLCRKHQISSELSFNWLFSLIFWIKQFIGISSLIQLIQKHRGKHAFTSFILENFKPTENVVNDNER